MAEIERMAGETPGSEITPLVSGNPPGSSEVNTQVPPQAGQTGTVRPSFSPGYDPKREDYEVRGEGDYVIAVDPTTGEKVAMIPKISGGAERPQLLDRNNLEFEASPERGREITEEIVRGEALRVAGRYNEVDWDRLNQLYRDQIIHTEAFGLVALKIKPFEGGEEPQPAGQEILNVNLENLTGLSPLGDLIEAYNRGAITPEQMPEFQRQVSAYFKEAKRIGLLRDLDTILSSVYERQVKAGIRRKFTSDEIIRGNPSEGIPGVNERIQQALRSLEDIYRDRLWVDPEIARLVGIGELYAQLARARFNTAINNRDIDERTQRPYFTDSNGEIQEFQLGLDGVEGVPEEKYWHLERGYYIIITAQTQEEFTIAADDYIFRLESITAAPDKILQDATTFVDVLVKSDGATKLLQSEDEETRNFIPALIRRIEARIGVFGADSSNELYNADYYKRYMDYINKDGKGPDRYLELIKSLDGRVAAALWAFDKDPRWEILFSLHGSRGNLAKAADAQRMGGGSTQGLFHQVRDLFIEEMMGVTLKDRRNVANLTKWMSDREFTNLFDGLYRYGKIPADHSAGDANIWAYQQAIKESSDGQLTPAQMRDPSIRLGKIQLEIQGIREKIKNGQAVLKRDGKAYDPSRDQIHDLLQDPADAKFYKKARDEAEKAFDIAFQMYGVLGEKSKRAGGVFTVNKVDGQGRPYQDFVPVHYAEKFVQFAETWTKMKHADLSAKDRTARVKAVRDRAIAELKKNGFEARLYDDEGRLMMLRRPKEDLSKEDELARDANNNVITEEVPVTFYIATHHPYGDWTSHTYWSYQEEDRHRILSPVTCAQARAIRDGKLRSEDATPWAIQLLIIDPTLKRVRRFTAKHFEERERKLTAAAVEDSYQSHWRIGRELYRAFFPKYGTPTSEINIYYGLQDYGGFRKMVEHARARVAEDPERFTRRGRRLIPDIHIPAAALSEIWGQGTVGALGVMRMFGAPIYRMGGAFALDKFAAQAEIANKLYGALFNTQDNEGNIVEGLLLKLTVDADVNLQPFFQKIPRLGEWWSSPPQQQEFLAAVRKTFARLERYEKLFTTMETTIRNANGALWLENVDVLANNGQLSPEIERRFASLPDITNKDLSKDDLVRLITETENSEKLSEEEFNSKFNKGEDEGTPGIDEGSISESTGSGKHSARLFHDAFFAMLFDEGRRGGVRLYPTERFIYKHLKDKIVYINPGVKGGVAETRESEDIIDWLFSKYVPT